ncbi:uncharacterized protein LOC143919396 [Arctopsyche grandis]|uniref:uncharacterized protein LOC143919396 n=1 Tax=Arctopsyche grandis TaxID=121162 RepID=UPI00406D9FE3
MNEELVIAEVQKRPPLYDKSLNSYKKATKREELWIEVATILDCDVNGLKKRWRSLRDGFIKNYRVQKTCPSGSAGGKKKSWPFYSQMEFLIPHVEFRECTGNYESLVDIVDIPVELQESIMDPVGPPVITQQHPVTTQYPTTTQHPVTRRQPVARNRRRNRRTSTENRLLDVLSNEQDSDQNFLLSLMPSLKRLSHKKNSEARIKLQHVLFEMEYGEPSPNDSHSSPSFPYMTHDQE